MSGSLCRWRHAALTGMCVLAFAAGMYAGAAAQAQPLRGPDAPGAASAPQVPQSPEFAPPIAEARAESPDSAVRVRASIDPPDTVVGGVITLTVIVDAPRSAAVIWPEPSDKESVFRIRRAGEPQDIPEGERRVHQMRWRLDTFAPGAHDIPALVLAIEMSGESLTLEPGPLRVRVRSVADPGEMEPRDLMPWTPVEDLDPTSARLYVLAAALLGVALCAAALLVLRGRGERSLERKVPADERALHDLYELAHSGMIERGEFEPLHTRLTGILRRYIEERYAVRAQEQTSRELLHAAAQHVDLAPHRDRLSSILRAADLVKFAAVQPQRSACSEAITMVRDFVQTTAPREELVRSESAGKISQARPGGGGAS